MLCRTRLRRIKLDNSRFKLSSEGTAPHTGPHRVRMPWTASKEPVPTYVYRQRDRALIDQVELFKSLGRIEQLEPLVAIKAICSKRDYLVSTGLTLFQLAAHLKHEGRGQRFWRDSWQDGTCDKYVTLSRIMIERDISAGGEAWGYVTFQGESTMRPIKVDHANTPGWNVEYVESRAVHPSHIVEPPPSIGTEVPVDPAKYKLKAYPYYDAPVPQDWELRLHKERGVIPDPVVAEGDAPPADPSVDDGSTHVAPK
jgi:hypothetical protein